MFRDESQQVVRKARNSAAARKSRQARKTRRTLSPSESSPESTSGATTVSVSRSSDVIDFGDESPVQTELIERQPLRRIQPSHQTTQDEAVCYFIQYNRWPGFHWMIDLRPDFLASSGFSVSQEAMKASVGAVGTAMLGRVRQDTSMVIAAGAEYGCALQMLAFAVSDPAEVKANSTLGAVLMLAIFEVSGLDEPSFSAHGWLRQYSRSLPAGQHKILKSGRTIFAEPRRFLSCAVQSKYRMKRV
jgi:hypothetical protein